MTWMTYGLITAVGFGIGDFLAGFVTRKVPVLTVVLYSKCMAAIGMTGTAILLGGKPVGSDLVWGGIAGSLLALGSVVYYRALAVGPMGLTAAVAGVGTAVIPFLVGLGLGERPGTVAVIGVVLVVCAIALVSAGGGRSTYRADPAPGTAGRFPGLLQSQRGFVIGHESLLPATLAGVCFGLIFVCLDQADSGSALWPTAVAVTAVAVFLLVYLLFRRQGSPVSAVPLRFAGIIVAVGLCQTLAILTFILGTRQGLLSIVSVAGALSPVPTAVCAWLILRQHLTRLQLAGISFALSGVVMMTLGVHA